MLQLISQKEQSLKEFTENNYAQASFFWTTLLKDKEIKVNGKRVNGDVRLYAGDTVTYYLNEKQAKKAAFYSVYEDENILIVDKESGVNSEAVFAALLRERECYFIHRLDRNTRGLMAFALSQKAADKLLAAFKEKRVEKRYHALCFGKFPKEKEVLTAYLQKNAQSARVKIYNKAVSGAEKILTEYAVLEKFADMTKAEIVLHTGKTHQIRAHLSFIGCPIVGDMKYGDTAKNKALKAARQCLVAKRLRFDLDGEYAYLNGQEFISRFEAELEK
ncbi:MAG: RluA family pseudouridine synthase [Clostridia bacterium]|nr:RluA family pseudouridine synthase [Clostridia bacterium]